MERRSKTVVRKGSIHRFTIEGTEYSAFIWQVGSQFYGRIDGKPQIAECRGGSVKAVRELLTEKTAESLPL